MRNHGLRYLNFNNTSMASISERDVKHTRSKALANSIHNLQNTVNAISKSKQSKKSVPPKPIETCPVCFDEIKEKKGTSYLTCGHVIHTSCLISWGRIKDTCPLCRHKEFEPPVVNKELNEDIIQQLIEERMSYINWTKIIDTNSTISNFPWRYKDFIKFVKSNTPRRPLGPHHVKLIDDMIDTSKYTENDHKIMWNELSSENAQLYKNAYVMTLFGDYICGNMTNVLYDAKAYVEGDLDLNEVFQENPMEEEEEEAEEEFYLNEDDLSEDDFNTHQVLRDILQDEAIAHDISPEVEDGEVTDQRDEVQSEVESPEDDEDDAINIIPNTNTGGDTVSANNSSLLTSPLGRSVLNSPIPTVQSLAMEEEKTQDIELPIFGMLLDEVHVDTFGQPRVGPPRL